MNYVIKQSGGWYLSHCGCCWTPHQVRAKRFSVATAAAFLAAWPRYLPMQSARVVRLVPRKKPLTGPELGAKFGSKPHGGKAGV